MCSKMCLSSTSNPSQSVRPPLRESRVRSRACIVIHVGRPSSSSLLSTTTSGTGWELPASASCDDRATSTAAQFSSMKPLAALAQVVPSPLSKAGATARGGGTPPHHCHGLLRSFRPSAPRMDDPTMDRLGLVDFTAVIGRKGSAELADFAAEGSRG